MIKIIQLKDGLDVEVEVTDEQARQISSFNKVESSIEDIRTFLKKIMTPLTNTFKELNKEVAISETKLSVGIKIGIEGGFILAKSAAEAHLQIEITLRDCHE